MTNEEVMQKLSTYFLTQDPKIIARLASSLLIDIHALYNIKELQRDKQEALLKRVKDNIQTLHEFLYEENNGMDQRQGQIANEKD